MSDEVGVFQDENRHTCIRVGSDKKQVKFIPFSASQLAVKKLTHYEFERAYTKLPDYAPQRAAEKYLFDKDGVKIEITPEARAHLERIAGAPYDRSKDSVADVQVNIPSSAPTTRQQESSTMATEKKSAPAKRPAAKKAAAAAPAKKASKKAAATESAGRGRAPNIADNAKIKLLVKENPKRAAAAERFALYKSGMTVAEYIEAGGKRADVNWDVKQGFIEVK